MLISLLILEVSTSLAITIMVLVLSSATNLAPENVLCALDFLLTWKTELRILTNFVASAYSSGMTETSCPMPETSMAFKIRINRFMFEYTSVMISIFVGG